MIFSIVDNDRHASMKVVGVGGAGGNAINRMISAGLEGVDFIAINTDTQALELSCAPERIHIGNSVTKGLGTGAKPDIGRQAIEEDRDRVAESLSGADMIFITAGMGGGTGTGASPVIAELAKDQGALTVGIVTKPFKCEGLPRMRCAESGLVELKKYVDTLIVIPNQRLLSVVSKDTTLAEAFRIADEVLLRATQGISELISTPGLINLDFSDVKTVMLEGGDALMGTGSERGDDRATKAAQKAIESPLLEGVSIAGAKAVLVNITGADNLTLFEVDAATTVITETAGEEANIILGTVLDQNMGDELRVTVIATGFSRPENMRGGISEIIANKVPHKKTLYTDIPAYIRKQQGNGKKTATENEQLQELNPDDLEYPTFLRKRMDQG